MTAQYPVRFFFALKYLDMLKAIIALIIAPSIVMGQDFFGKADKFFLSAVEEGSVKYEQVKDQPAELNSLIEQVESYKVDGKDKNELLAFYCNAYNLLVIKGITNSYPVKSPMDIQGFFDNKNYTVAGEKLSLNQLENEKIRPFGDARIHFALVCAAKGCPKIKAEAFTPSKVQQQLQSRTDGAMNDGSFLKYRSGDKKAEISKIFEWYASDFEGKENFKAFINKYRVKPIPDSVKLEFYEYDWALNEKK